MTEVDATTPHRHGATVPAAGGINSAGADNATAGGATTLGDGAVLKGSALQGLHRRLPYAKLKLLPLLVMMVAFVARFGTDSVDNLRAYQQDAYDLSLYDQGIWLLSRFHAPFMTVMGTDMFAAHTAFIFVLLVPIYWVYPHAAALLELQAAALALGAVPVYLLGQRLLRSTWLATLLAAAYLLNPAIQLGTMNQFHVEAFEAPLLALAIYTTVVWRPRLLAVAVVLLLACKQDDALYLVPLGLVVAWLGHRREGANIALAAIIVALVENLVLVPLLLNGVPVSYGQWWPFTSFHETLKVLVRTPGQFWDFAVSQSRPWYVWQMFFSSGIVFVLSPAVMGIAILEFAADSLSSNPYLHQIEQHYSMPVAAVFACAGVCAIATLRTPRRKLVATALVTVCALWGCVLWGDASFSDNPLVPADPNTPAVASLNRLVKKIPSNAVLSVAQNLAPNLDHRDQVYLFPTPFSQSYYGNPAFNGTRLPFASQVQYLLLPTCMKCDTNMGQPDQDVFEQIAGQFHVVGRSTGYVLYERVRP